MDKIKFAIVGCGSIGKRHIAVLDADPDAEIVAICDIDEKKCIEQSGLYNGLRYFTDYDEMLASIKCDVVNVVTPHQLHAEMSIKAMRKGFHVLVEKPMALTTADCDRMNAVHMETGKKLWVVKQNRFNVPILLAKEVIEQNRLGKIFIVKCDVLWNRYQGYYDDSPWRGVKANEGGALFTQASHFIDLLVWWFGDITSAQTNIETQNHDIETEDTGLSVVKFANDALGSIIWTTCVYNKNYEGSITIVGEKGTIKIGGQYLNKIEYWDVEGYPLPEGIDFSDKPNAYGKYQGTSSNHDKVIKAIISQLRGLTDQTVSGFEGIRSIKAIELMYKHAK
jgi:UDP-N-acetyl-2-amino-2-deoxyglucuronate dehydrogenase